VIGLAIAFIVGGAAGRLLTASVNDLLMPIIAVIVPGGEWRTAVFYVGPIMFLLGDLVGALIDFIIIALVVLLLSKQPAKTKLITQMFPFVPFLKAKRYNKLSCKFLVGDYMPKIKDIEGIGSIYAKKLTDAGVKTTEDLLKVGATAKGREELGKKTGIANKLILEWVNLADLYRIKGVGQEYSDLLEEAGVDTVVELAKRVPENLHAKMLEVNEQKKLVRRPPSLSAVKDWVEQAKKLKRIVEY